MTGRTKYNKWQNHIWQAINQLKISENELKVKETNLIINRKYKGIT